jgi:aspartate 1-decarboxylase
MTSKPFCPGVWQAVADRFRHYLIASAIVNGGVNRALTIDEDLLNAADILEYEQIDIYNVTNGERFTTYAIRGERGSGIVSVNGAAARKAAPGDLLIVVSYGVLTEDEVRYFQPRLIYVDARNRILSERAAIPVQLAA